MQNTATAVTTATNATNAAQHDSGTDILWAKRLRELIDARAEPSSVRTAIQRMAYLTTTSTAYTVEPVVVPAINMTDVNDVLESKRYEYEVMLSDRSKFPLGCVFCVEHALAIHVYTVSDLDVYKTINEAMSSRTRRGGVLTTISFPPSLSLSVSFSRLLCFCPLLLRLCCCLLVMFWTLHHDQ